MLGMFWLIQNLQSEKKVHLLLDALTQITNKKALNALIQKK